MDSDMSLLWWWVIWFLVAWSSRAEMAAGWRGSPKSRMPPPAGGHWRIVPRSKCTATDRRAQRADTHRGRSAETVVLAATCCERPAMLRPVMDAPARRPAEASSQGRASATAAPARVRTPRPHEGTRGLPPSIETWAAAGFAAGRAVTSLPVLALPRPRPWSGSAVGFDALPLAARSLSESGTAIRCASVVVCDDTVAASSTSSGA